MKLSLKALQCIVWSGYDDKAMSAGLSRQQMRSTFARPQNTSRGNKLHYYIVPLQFKAWSGLVMTMRRGQRRRGDGGEIVEETNELHFHTSTPLSRLWICNCVCTCVCTCVCNSICTCENDIIVNTGLDYWRQTLVLLANLDVL